MENDLSEKPSKASPPASSHGDSTDDTGKHKSEGHAVEAPSGTLDEIQKLDSEVIKVGEGEEDPFKHLPADEAAILKRQIDITVIPTSFKQLYRYATRVDKIIVTISAICAIAGGAALPLMTVIRLSENIEDILAKTQNRSSLANSLVPSKVYLWGPWHTPTLIVLYPITFYILCTSQLQSL